MRFRLKRFAKHDDFNRLARFNARDNYSAILLNGGFKSNSFHQNL
jgi:hypothetical protein